MPYYARATAHDDGTGIAIVESDTGAVWTEPGHPDVLSALESARQRAAAWNGRDLEIITRLLGLPSESAPEVTTDTAPTPEPTS